MSGPRPLVAICTLLLALISLTTLFWPGVVAGLEFLRAPEADPALLDRSAFGRTLLWSLLVPLAAIVPGLLGARWLARLLERPRASRTAAALTILPLCLPGYAVFWCWWQAFGPGTRLGDLALEHGFSVRLREAVLLLSLACWSWPLLAWPVALARRAAGGPLDRLAALDGAGVRRRAALRLRSEGPAALLGLALIAFLTAATTISFDLAQVPTLGFELRALDATGAAPGTVLRVALPFLVTAILGALICLRLLDWTGRRWQPALARRAAGEPWPGGFAWSGLLVLVASSTLLPLGLAFRGIGGLEPGLFWTLHRTATFGTLRGALIDGLLAALLAVLLFIPMARGGRRLRGLTTVIALLWFAAALVPAIVVCAALTATWNGPSTGPLVYDGGGALVLGHLARTGGLAAAIALFFAWSEARTVSEARRLDPPRLSGLAPRLRGVALITFAVAAVWSLGELVIATRLLPPGEQRIASTLLNAMHYQRPDTVLLGLAGLVLCGWVLAFLLAHGLPSGARRSLGGLGACLLAACLPACTDPSSSADAVAQERGPRLDAAVLVGAPGRGPGLFAFPRGIALDAARERFYVVDKTSRVQRFSLDGELEAWWRLPEWTVGKPVGLSIAPDGRVFVPDTHYHRILVYDPDGNELQRFGRFGTGPGEFVYPTDIAFAPDGSLYVSEYGTNDRIQIFTPEGVPVRAFGRFGREEGAFARPQSIALSADRAELYVADTCNHRIAVHALDGTHLRTLAGAGTGPGRLSYPHGLELLPDGTLLVSEIGTDRVQRLDALTGASLGVWGGSGFERGLLRTPWGVASDGETLLVLDSGNARVQIGPLPEARSSDGAVSNRD